MFSVPRGTVSKVMTAFEKERKTSSANQNSGRKKNAVLKRPSRFKPNCDSISQDYCPKITGELNEYLQNSVSINSSLQNLNLHHIKIFFFQGISIILSNPCISVNISLTILIINTNIEKCSMYAIWNHH